MESEARMLWEMLWEMLWDAPGGFQCPNLFYGAFKLDENRRGVLDNVRHLQAIYHLPGVVVGGGGGGGGGGL